MRVSEGIKTLVPYSSGKPIEETQRELGLGRVTKLASNENPLGPSQIVQKAISKACSHIHRYPDAKAFQLKQAYSQFINVYPDQLLFGNGSNEIINLLIQTYCLPGDAILVSESSFIAYKIGARALNIDVDEIPLRKDLSIDIQKIGKHWTPRHKLIFLPNPNNPVGTIFSKNELVLLLEYLRDNKDVLIVLDEAYFEYVRSGEYPNGIELLKTYPNIIVLRTFSKVYGLAGLRLGVAISSRENLTYVNRVRQPFSVNRLALEAGIAALGDQDYIERSKQVVWEGLDYFYKQLEHLQITYWKSQGNFILLDVKEDSQVIFEKLLKEGLILRPVKIYGLETHLRLSVGTQEENQRAIAILEKVLAD